MTTVNLDLDDEILSSNESAPKAPAQKPADPASVQCHYCHESFDGPTRWFKRGTHEKSAHFQEWTAAKAPGAKKVTKAKAATKKAAPVKKATSTTTSTKRVSAADSLSDNIARAARMIGTANPAIGRALVFSAPATGQAIDEVVAGTIVDKVAIQRFAKAADKWDRLGGVLSFPILFAICSAKPDMLPILEADLREATVDVLIASIPSLIKKKEREKKAVDALARLGEVDERYATTTDPVGLMLSDLLFGFPEPGGDGSA